MIFQGTTTDNSKTLSQALSAAESARYELESVRAELGRRLEELGAALERSNSLEVQLAAMAERLQQAKNAVSKLSINIPGLEDLV